MYVLQQVLLIPVVAHTDGKPGDGGSLPVTPSAVPLPLPRRKLLQRVGKARRSIKVTEQTDDVKDHLLESNTTRLVIQLCTSCGVHTVILRMNRETLKRIIGI